MKKVAIIGGAFRFPGTTTDQYWNDLLNGRDLVSTVDTDRWSHEAFLHPNRNHPGTSYTFAAGSIGDISGFDAAFFGISPREAAQMDPQQRLLLELSWEAIENAGIAPERLGGTDCSVFIGMASADYSYRVATDLGVVESAFATGNTASIAANRISYIFDLKGPSMAVDTACSSSLVAFHQACRSIVSGESTHALAGGISLHLHPYGFITFSKASMLSPDGRCKVFDANGNGYVRSEGGAIVLLKDYDQAVVDGDRILAVVPYTAVNTDGRKQGLTVPSSRAQAELVTRAYQFCGIEPDDIDYIEAHGTGTAVGDPIETRALSEALGSRRRNDNPLPIGSVKSNMGHLETASGMAGLFKAIYAIQHRVVPGTIGIETFNPAIPLDEWNLRVVQENWPLKPTGKITIGVNSFGFGGANAHIVLQSANEADNSRVVASGHTQTTPPDASDTPSYGVPTLITARTADALRDTARQWAKVLSETPTDIPADKSAHKPADTPSDTRTDTSPPDHGIRAYDLAGHSVFKRQWHQERAVVYARSNTELLTALESLAEGKPLKQIATGKGSSKDLNAGLSHTAETIGGVGPVFAYSGNGSQWQGMGRKLLADPVFAEAIEQVDHHFEKLAGFTIRSLIDSDDDSIYAPTEYAQPALFAIQVGITTMLRAAGVRPTAVVGHSVGEVAAAWACEALSLSDAVSVIYHRSYWQGQTRGRGFMSAVSLQAQATQQWIETLGLSDSVWLAGANSSRGSTIAGTLQGLEQFEAAMAQEGVSVKRLDLDYAFHSPMMDEVESGVRSQLAGISPRKSSIPFYSVVHGGLLEGTSLDAEYWWLNIRRPVQFEQAIDALVENGQGVFVEVGPHAILRGYITDALNAAEASGKVIATGRRGVESPEAILATAGQVIINGGQIDWASLFPTPPQWVDLPAYPWQRDSLWYEGTSQSMDLLNRVRVHPLLGFAVPQQPWMWESTLDTDLLPSFGDHKVGDSVVFPGTGFAEIALAASTQWQPGAVARVHDLEILSPLLLDAGVSREMRVTLDPADGHLTIEARTIGTDESWRLHARARVLPEPSLIGADTHAPALPARQADFTAREHTLFTLGAGLQYGPAYCAVDKGWKSGPQGREIAAVLTLPDSIAAEMDNYLLHPALLDNSYQLIIHYLREFVALDAGVTYVPTQMGEIIWYAQPDRVAHQVQVNILTRNPNSITAEFALFNRSGQIVAHVRQARFSAMHLKRKSASALQYLKYQNIPAPRAHTLTVPAPMGLHEWFACMQNTAQTIQQSPFEERFATETDPLLDVLVARYFADYLIKHGGNDPRVLDDKIHALELATHSAGQSQRRLLEVLLDLAQQNDLLSRRDNNWHLNEEAFSEVSASDIWLTLLRDSGHAFPLIHAAGRLGMHLENLLDLHNAGTAQSREWNAGQQAAVDDSLFNSPEIDISEQEGLRDEADPATSETSGEAEAGTQGNTSEWSWRSMLPVLVGPHGMHAIEQAVHQRLQYAINELAPGQKIFVTEISSGESWFGSACTQGFNADLIEYTQQSVPDTEALSGVDPEEIRLQIAIVVLDADTPDEAQRMLRWASARLLPDGVLMVIGANASDWVQALLAAESPGKGIPGSSGLGACQYGADSWALEVEALCGKPVKRLALWPTDEGPGASGPYLLFAEKKPSPVKEVVDQVVGQVVAQVVDGVVAQAVAHQAETTADDGTDVPSSSQPSRKPRCLILTDGTHTGQLEVHAYSTLRSAFISAMAQRLDTQAVPCPETAQELEQLLADFCRQNSEQPSHIIDLRGWLAVTDSSDPDEMLANQTQRCADIARTATSLQGLQYSGQYWVPALSELADAAISGFMRTLMNEASGLTARLITFELGNREGCAKGQIETVALTSADQTTVTNQVQAWVHEVCHPDAEQEIVISAAGMRSVPHLRALPAPLPAAEQSGLTATGVQAEGTGRTIQAGRTSKTTTGFSPDLLQSRQIRLGFDMPGQLRNLRWEAVDRPALQDDEVEIAVKATGLNFRDVMYTLGLLSDEAVENGFAGASIGLEFAGVVSRVGAEVTDYKSGDEVVGFGPHGFTNFAITTSSALALLPRGMSFESAATVPSTFFTAYYALIHQARLQPGESVLIHGAAGGVGLAAIQIALWQGANVYATAGSAAKQDLLRLLGIEHIYSSRHLDFADEILRDTDGQGVDVVLNSLSGEAINRNLQVLKPFGRFLELGKRDFYENSRIGLRPFRNNVSYFGIDADQLMKVRPDLTSQLFRQVMNLFEEGILYPLPYEAYEAVHALDAFRQMQQARHIGKIVVTYNDGVPTPVKDSTNAASSMADSTNGEGSDQRRGLHLDENACYLVTGGLSGFGLRTAQWLTDKGARHLVLLGRRGAATEQAQQAVAELQSKGVNVIAPPCDITLTEDLRRVLQDEMKDMPPIKGIVHAAAVFEDSLIMNLDHDKIQAVMAPKILGALNLHRLTDGNVVNPGDPLSTPLDFFVVYSSGTTLFGNPGQANYVAANTWLEAFCEMRREQGLAATCALWGAIQDAGFLARNTETLDALQNRMGGKALLATEALDALEALMLSGRSGEGVLDYEWRALKRFLPSASSPKFSEIAALSPDSADGGGQASEIQALLDSMSDEELLPIFMDMLRSEVAEILRISPDKLEPDTSLYDIGLDSLMGVELMLAIENRFGQSLPTMSLADNHTLSKLAALLLKQMRQSGGAGTGETGSNGAANSDGSLSNGGDPVRNGALQSQAHHLARQHAADMTSEEIEEILATIEPASEPVRKGEQR